MLGKFIQLRMQGVRDPFMSMANGGGGKGKAPKAPDYMALAREQTEMQKDINRETLAANRVNQVTPYGNLDYSQTGTDQYGNPTFTATQVLSPEQQKLYQQNTNLASGMLTGAEQGLGSYAGVMANPTVDQSQLAQIGINPGEVYSDAIMRRLQPQIAQENASFENRLVNQGIAPGTEAYNNAKRDFDQRQNDKLTSAVVGGMNTGLAANQQVFSQAGYNQMQPINVINALRTGSQVQAPNYINPALQSTTAGPDLLGATTNRYNAEVGNVNAANANTANFVSGLMNLGGSIYGRK
jgi:hypothetical protein